MASQEYYFEKGGIKLYYQISGTGRPLLLLNGVGLSILTAQDKIAVLSKKYQVIAADVPGFGKSGVPNQIWDFEDYANFLK